MRKRNHLNSAEMYRLTKCVEESAELPFDSWKQAILMMSEHMGRDVTRSNIETAAGNCGVDVNGLVKVGSNSHPFANMMAQVNELKKRVAELERLVGSCND